MMFDDESIFGVPSSDDIIDDYIQVEKANAMDYYGTAMQFFPAAQADLINVENTYNNMTINNNDLGINNTKTRRRRK